MLIALTLTSILALTALAYGARRTILPGLCPVCAGVAGTWLWLLGAHWAGYPVDLRLPAILLGGTVVGLASQGDSLLAERGETFRLGWKTSFIAAGFGTAWFVTVPDWVGAAIGLTALGALGLPPLIGTALRHPEEGLERIEQLKEQMKGCC